MSGSRLTILLSFGLSVFEAYLFATHGEVGRVGPTIAAGAVLIAGVMTFAAISKVWAGGDSGIDLVAIVVLFVIGLALFITGVTLLATGQWIWQLPGVASDVGTASSSAPAAG